MQRGASLVAQGGPGPRFILIGAQDVVPPFIAPWWTKGMKPTTGRLAPPVIRWLVDVGGD